jgi:pheromone a factor receptor
MATVINIYTFYKRGSQCRKMMSSTSGFSQSRYLRLMAISSVELLGTIPLSMVIIVADAIEGFDSTPWRSWADTHSHYSVVPQIAGFIWKDIPKIAFFLEMYRWLLVACAFIFFALFGFAGEAREQYYRLYKLLAKHISTSPSTPHRASHAYVAFVHYLASS